MKERERFLSSRKNKRSSDSQGRNRHIITLLSLSQRVTIRDIEADVRRPRDRATAGLRGLQCLIIRSVLIVVDVTQTSAG